MNHKGGDIIVTEKKRYDVEASAPIGNYRAWVRSGNLVFIAGQGPKYQGTYWYNGKVGRDVSEEQAYEAARITGENLLACLKDACGKDLSRVKRIVNLRGYVNSTDEFQNQPRVIDGVSDLLAEALALGDEAKAARCAISVNSLPLGMCVEAEMVAELKD